MVVNPHFVPIPHPRTGRFKSFASFYPFYLGARVLGCHCSPCRRRLRAAGCFTAIT